MNSIAMKKLSLYIILFIIIYVSIELLAYCSLFVLKKYVYLDYYPTDVLTDNNVNDINELIKSNTNNYIIYSATLGWSIKSNGFTKLYQANSAGLRGNRNYSKIPEDGVFRISSYGDSFTHCDDVFNNETWQTYIEESDARFEVLNFGVGAYGLDQSFLRYLETKNRFKSDYVLIGYMTENIARNVNNFRPFYVPMSGLPLTKPRFVIKDDTLALVPNYMQKLEDYKDILDNPMKVISELGVNDYFYKKGYQSNIFDWSPTIRILSIFNRILKIYLTSDAINTNGIYNENSEAFNITIKLFDKFYSEVIVNGSKPIIIIFPHRKDIARYQGNDKKQYSPLINYLDSKDFDSIDLMDILGNENIEALFADHYTPFANELVSGYILNYVNNLDK